MLCEASKNETGLAGAQVCGHTLYPADGDSVFTVIRMPHVSCGVTVEKGVNKPYLRLAPGIQVPVEGRAGFERFLFECDDDEMVDLKFDAKDGEIVVNRPLAGLSAADVERALTPALAWVDQVVYPEVMGYVAGLYGDEKKGA